MSKLHTTLSAFTIATLALGAIAQDHAHIAILGADTPGGPTLEIRAGYYPSEAGVTIDDARRLRLDGELLTLGAGTLQTGGAFDGWYFVDSGNINPSADFFASTLGNADTYYEIASVVGLEGASDSAFAFFSASHEGRHGDTIARSDAADLFDRSIPTPPGTHRHGYSYFARDLGLYEVTLRAFDASGTFAGGADGLDRVSFQVRVVPAPGGLALLGVSVFAFRRRR